MDGANRGLARRFRPLRRLNDDDLTAAAAGGDPRALGVIFERYHEPLYRYCAALLGDAGLAASALQTTMLAAREGLNEGMPPTAMRPWLHAIAHAASLALIRERRQSEPRVERSALLLHEMNGLDYAEVAAALGITRTAARRAALDARDALPPEQTNPGRELRERYALPAGVAEALLGAGEAAIGLHDDDDRPRHRVLLSVLVLAVVTGSAVALAALGTFDSGGGGGSGQGRGGPGATPIQVAPGGGPANPGGGQGRKGQKPRRRGSRSAPALGPGAAPASAAAPPAGAPPSGPSGPSSAVSAYSTPGERVESAVGAP
jgi:DNA-directed RNA polymerase specialized sigma24 family protein